MRLAQVRNLGRPGLIAAAVLLAFGLGAAAANAGTLNNTAHATGTAPGGGSVSSAQDTVSLPVTPKDPKYTVNKTVANGTVSNGLSSSVVDAPGDSLIYTIAVANTGNVTLNAPALTDAGPVFGTSAATGTFTVPSSPTSGDTNSNNVIDVGETWSYQVTYVLTQADIDHAAAGGGSVANTVSVAVTDPQGSPAPLDPVATSNPTATSTLPATSSMSIDKTATVSTDGGLTFAAMTTGQTLKAGDIVKYNYAVTNTGNTTLTSVAIGEDTFNGTGGTGAIVVPGTIASLAPGQTLSLTANNYTVTQADIDSLQ